MAVSVAKLTPDLGVAVVRGFGRALAEAQTPAARSVTLRDLVMVHEARGDWAAAAAALRAEAAQRTDVAVDLGRAARDLLRAGRPADAETTLLDAVRRTPDEGTLYRSLAVDVYAARGQFDLAEQTLERGERNARDMDPVYDGVAELLTRREASWHAAADR